MDVTRSVTVLVVLAVPAGVLGQEPASGFATPSHWASVGSRSMFLRLADEGTREAPVRIVIPAETFETLLHQSNAQRPWQAVDASPPGEHVIITLRSGEVVEGPFRYATAEEVFLTGGAGDELRIPKAQIRQVTGEKKDTSVDGLLIGAAVGAGFGVLIGYDRRTFECRSRCSIAIGTTLFTPIGALVGWLRDRKTNHSETLYEVP